VLLRRLLHGWSTSGVGRSVALTPSPLQSRTIPLRPPASSTALEGRKGVSSKFSRAS
jgi:hypothetical protein